jgi:hypothetical protein
MQRLHLFSRQRFKSGKTHFAGGSTPGPQSNTCICPKFPPCAHEQTVRPQTHPLRSRLPTFPFISPLLFLHKLHVFRPFDNMNSDYARHKHMNLLTSFVITYVCGPTCTNTKTKTSSGSAPTPAAKISSALCRTRPIPVRPSIVLRVLQ